MNRPIKKTSDIDDSHTRKLNVAMVAACPFPANHGTPANIKEMAIAVSSLGHKVHIVTYPMGQDIPVKDMKVHRAGRLFRKCKISVGPTYYKPLLDLLLVMKLCKVIRQENIDIIHAHNYEGALAGYIAKKITKRPMIYNAVNNMISELPSYDFIKPRSLAVKLANLLDILVPRTGDYVTTISDELRDFILQKGVSEDKIAVIDGGVSTEMFECDKPDMMRERFNVGRRPLVVYTGVLDRFQRIDYLLKAMRTVIDCFHDAVLLVVPSIINTSELERNKELAVELGIEKNVIFTDERPFKEIPYFLASADVAVIPRTDCPGTPIKLLNYMAAGKAIVAFEGSAKGIKNMINAIVVKNHAWEEFGRNISILIKDRELAKKARGKCKD